MYIKVDGSDLPALALCDANDFGSFKVVVVGMSERDPRLADALEPHGWLASDGVALLRIDAVKALAGDRGRDAAWRAHFDDMVAYARSRGWLSEDESAIQAHCEYPA